MVQHYYYITWNPDPSKFNYLSYEIQFDLHWGHLVKLVEYFDDWAFSPELSPTGRLHYHGYFQLKPKQRDWTKSLQELRTYGHIAISKVRTRLDDTYMRKENYEMERLLKIQLPIYTKEPILIDQKDVLDWMAQQDPRRG